MYPTTPATVQTADSTVETLLSFIDENASSEVFEKAQDLVSFLSLEAQGLESDLKEAQAELKELREELTDGNALASYASELKNFNVLDFIGQILDERKFRDAIDEELKDRLFQDGTTYLAVPESFDAMDAILAPRLAERIAQLGIADALRLLENA